MSVWDWPLLYAAGYLVSSLFDPVIWGLALISVLLGRRLKWPGWVILATGAGLAALGSLMLTLITRPEWEINLLRVSTTLVVSLFAAGLVVLVLHTFDKAKAT